MSVAARVLIALSQVGLFLVQGLLSLTLMSICVTSIFWVAVLRTGLSRAPVGFRQLWPWVVGCVVVLVVLEFLDGILYFSALSYDENLLFAVQNTLFALVAVAAGQLMLWSGTYLLRRVRVGQALKTAGRTRFQTSVAFFVVCELACCLVLAIWFLIAVWAGPMLFIDNVSWWAMWTVFYATILTVIIKKRASHSILFLFVFEGILGCDCGLLSRAQEGRSSSSVGVDE